MAEHQVINNEAAGRFEIRLEGEVAFTEYRLTGSGILFPHTLVPQALEGKGIGGELARTALDWARSQKQLVLPTCPFIAGWIERHPAYHDLVHPLYRAALHLASSDSADAELDAELKASFPASDALSVTRRET